MRILEDLLSVGVFLLILPLILLFCLASTLARWLRLA